MLKDALGRKVAILGDMGELGPQENELHREVGMYAGTLDIDRFPARRVSFAKNHGGWYSGAEYPQADVDLV